MNTELIARLRDPAARDCCSQRTEAADALEAAQAELEEWRFTNKIDELQRANERLHAEVARNLREIAILKLDVKDYAEQAGAALARLAEIEKAHTVSDQNISLIAHNEAAEDWNDLTFRDGWFAGFKDGFRAAEVQHGIKERHDAQ